MSHATQLPLLHLRPAYAQGLSLHALREENEQLRARLTAVEGAAADALGELEDLQVCVYVWHCAPVYACTDAAWIAFQNCHVKVRKYN